MKISFAKFIEMLDLPYKIPEYMNAFIKDMESNEKYCICLHRHAGRNTFNEIYKKYLKDKLN